MNDNLFLRLSEINWEETSQKLVSFAEHHALARYGWRNPQIIDGQSPEDIVLTAITKLYEGKRNCPQNLEIIPCIKRIIESIMNNLYRKSSSQRERDSLDWFESVNVSVDMLGPEEKFAFDEYITEREHELDRLMTEDKEIELYLEALMSVPDLDDDVAHLAQQLNTTPKEIYRIRRKLSRKTGQTKS